MVTRIAPRPRRGDGVYDTDSWPDGGAERSRRGDGCTTCSNADRGAAWGAVGGAVVGLIFPPALLASAAVGAGVGLGAGGLLSHGEKAAIKADVEDTLPLNSSGIVAMLEEGALTDVEKSLSQADKITKEEVDPDSAKEVKSAATAE